MNILMKLPKHQVVYYCNNIKRKEGALMSSFFHPTGMDHFQDFRVFHFFIKKISVNVKGQLLEKAVGVIQCKADCIDKGNYITDHLIWNK